MTACRVPDYKSIFYPIQTPVKHCKTESGPGGFGRTAANTAAEVLNNQLNSPAVVAQALSGMLSQQKKLLCREQCL